MNTKEIMDKAWSLAVEHVRKEFGKRSPDPIKVGVLTDAVNKELKNDDGLWIRRAMED